MLNAGRPAHKPLSKFQQFEEDYLKPIFGSHFYIVPSCICTYSSHVLSSGGRARHTDRKVSLPQDDASLKNFENIRLSVKDILLSNHKVSTITKGNSTLKSSAPPNTSTVNPLNYYRPSLGDNADNYSNLQ
jgi:hypothetical protein